MKMKKKSVKSVQFCFITCTYKIEITQRTLNLTYGCCQHVMGGTYFKFVFKLFFKSYNIKPPELRVCLSKRQKPVASELPSGSLFLRLYKVQAIAVRKYH